MKLLEGRFVNLRPLERSDIELVRNWRNSDNVRRFMASQEYISETQQKAWFERKVCSPDSAFFIVAEKSSGTPLGQTHLENISQKNRNACWGIIIGEEKARIGFYATNAAYLIFNYAFDVLNLEKLYGDCLASNEAALSFDSSLGFEREGLRKGHVCVEGKFLDLVEIGLSRDRWNSGTRRKLERSLAVRSQ